MAKDLLYLPFDIIFGCLGALIWTFSFVQIHQSFRLSRWEKKWTADRFSSTPLYWVVLLGLLNFLLLGACGVFSIYMGYGHLWEVVPARKTFGHGITFVFIGSGLVLLGISMALRAAAMWKHLRALRRTRR